MRSLRRPVAVSLLAVIALLAASCGDDDDDAAETTTVSTSVAPSSTTTIEATTTSEASTTTEPVATEDVLVYFLLNEKMHAVTRSVSGADPLLAAVQALLQGPNADEKAIGLWSNIPAGSEVRSLNRKGTIAEVDLTAEYASGGGSLSMFTRLAQVVFTLTQPGAGIDGVRFLLDGVLVTEFSGEGLVLDGPQDRLDYEENSPAILLERPTMGQTVSDPLRITGTSNTFEATFQVQLEAEDGTLLVDTFVTATSGMGTRGTFDVSLPFEGGTGPGTLRVFEYSAENGEPINVVEIPVEIA